MPAKPRTIFSSFPILVCSYALRIATPLISVTVDSKLNAFFDPSLDAFVNPMLLKDLTTMNALQQEREPLNCCIFNRDLCK